MANPGTEAGNWRSGLQGGTWTVAADGFAGRLQLLSAATFTFLLTTLLDIFFRLSPFFLSCSWLHGEHGSGRCARVPHKEAVLSCRCDDHKLERLYAGKDLSIIFFHSFSTSPKSEPNYVGCTMRPVFANALVFEDSLCRTDCCFLRGVKGGELQRRGFLRMERVPSGSISRERMV